MTTEFWGIKPPEDAEQSEKIHFPNPLKIEVDGKTQEFQLDKQTELSYEAIRAILSCDGFWILHLDADRNAFFQMHMESSLFEYWTDGEMQHQETGDIDDALKYLESIVMTDSDGQPAYVDNNDNPIPPSTAVAPTQQRIEAMQQTDVAKLASIETPETHKLYRFLDFVFIYFLIAILGAPLAGILDNGVWLFFSNIAAVLVTAREFLTRETIKHFKEQETYVWYEGTSVKFIYVKDMTDKLLTFIKTTTTSTSDGRSETNEHHYYRIIDANGGELHSDRIGDERDMGRLIALLGLKTMKQSAYKYPIKGAKNHDMNPKTAQMIVVMVSVGMVITFVVLVAGIFGIIPLFSWDGGYGDPYNGDYSYYDNDLPPLWCDETVLYPVTVPISVTSEVVIEETEGHHQRIPNRNVYTDSIPELAINGGVCNYQYRVGTASGFEITYKLDNVTNIDGVSIHVMEHPFMITNGYSGIEIYTSTNNGSTWTSQYESTEMYGFYERGATYETYAEDFMPNSWFRHQFSATAENVTHVRIETGYADQLGDTSVSFSALRIDAEGDYDYPDYLLCDGTWDGLFENSTSEMMEWPAYGERDPVLLGCDD